MRLEDTPTRFGSRLPRVTSTTTTSTTTGTSSTNRNESGGGRRNDDHDGDDDEDDVTDDEHHDRVAATRASTTTNTTNYSSSSTTPLLSGSICFQPNSNRSYIDSLSLSRLHVQNDNNNRVIATDENDDWCSERHRADAWNDTNGGDENIDDNNNIIICTNNNTIANTISSNNSYNSILLFRFRILFPWLYHNHQLGTPDDSTNDSLVAIVIGITTLIFIGSSIGTISYYSTTSPQQHSSSLSSHTDLVSSCIGYSYVIMWSVSFYPQCLLNRQRRTCTGLSIDFCWYNFVGFICYTTYNVALYFNPTIQRQYDARQPSQEDDHHHHSSASTTKIPIQANDVAFAVHALILCTILLFQVGYYDGISALRPSRQSSYILTVLLLCIVLYPIIFLVVVPTVTKAAVHHPTTYQMLDYIFFLSYIKVCITCMKYVPQVYYNYHRRSTVGWNIWQILLDLFGGIFSTSQLIYDAPPFTSTSDVMFRNLPKFMLGNISIVFDIIFIVQHYYLYPTTTTAMTREEPFTGSLTEMDEHHNPIAYHFLNTSDEDETDADV